MKLGMGNCVGLARLTSNLAGNWGHPEKKKDRLKGGGWPGHVTPKLGRISYLRNGWPDLKLARKIGFAWGSKMAEFDDVIKGGVAWPRIE
jgi:hypothetical protein